METKKKTLAIVTGTRAEYGLLRPVIQCLTRRDNLNAALLVTGAHLAPEYGSTVREIEADGVPIAARIPILTGETGPLATAHAVCWFWATGTRFLRRPRRQPCSGCRWPTSAAAT